MTPTREDLELYVMGCYDGDVAALEAHLADNPAARAIVADEAALELALREAADAATFCPACDDVVRDDRCATCGAAVRAGGYTIERVVVQNTHGRMYIAHDVDGRQVALKELAFVQAPGVDAQAAFEREARFLRALEHPAIPRFVASFEEGSGIRTRYYLAQELVAGVPLEARLADHFFDEKEIIEIARCVLGVLVYLQGLSPIIVHRDIKPANLLRRPDGTIAVVDFGAAHVGGATIGSTSIGTFGYMPVEQMAGQIDATTDAYALGASLLHLLTRREPWKLLQAPDWDAVNVSPALRNFLQRLVAAEARNRFATAADALAALDRVTRGEEVAVIPIRTRTTRFWSPLLLAASALLALGGTGVVGYWLGMRPHAQPQATPIDGGVYIDPTYGMPMIDPPARNWRLSPPVIPDDDDSARTFTMGTPTKPIDLDYKNARAADVFATLAQKCGFNLVLPDTIEFNVTLQLAGVPCYGALQVILESHGLWYRNEADEHLLRIAPRKMLDSEDEAAALRGQIRNVLGIPDDNLPEGPGIDLDFKNAPIRDVLQMLAKTGGVNIVTPDTVDGTVTIKVAGVAWHDVLPVVLEAHGLWYRYREHGRVLRIAPRKELDSEEAAALARRHAQGTAGPDAVVAPTR